MTFDTLIVTTTGAVLSGVLGAMLVGAVVSDLRERRVSNKLNLALLSVGVLVAFLTREVGDGARQIALGVLLALVIWFPMFAFRLMGAGDVKLMAASGAWLGWQGVVIASLATGIFGGMLGVFWLLRSHGALSAMQTMATAVRAPGTLKLRPYEARERVPYALAVAAGVCLAWFTTGGAALQLAHFAQAVRP